MTGEATSNAGAAQVGSPGSVLRRLHEQCTLALESSVAAANEEALGASHVFGNDLESWLKALKGQTERQLIETAASEYLIAQMNLCQGQYRNSYKGLRLVLELCVQAVHLSADLILREEWLRGDSDTNWTTLMHEDSGPFALRHAAAFFPALKPHTPNFRGIARTLYRELSECIHGNTPVKIPLPASIAFDQPTFDLWHEKARLVRRVVLFALTQRYLRGMSSTARSLVADSVLDQLGHIDPIRVEFESHE